MVTKTGHKLKGKKVLITAGPTWVPIDSVRVISNIASGQTGILLAQHLAQLGADVTLVLGPANACCINNKIRLIRFKFFDELKGIIHKEVRSKKYTILIHSAAVSDYRPERTYSHKVESRISKWKLNLIPTRKIIDDIKKLDPNVVLVGFKFKPQAKTDRLISEAKRLIRQSGADLVVANTISNGRYSAYILNEKRISGLLRSKHQMARELIRRLKVIIP